MATSKSEAYLQRKFAELCARIKRVDLIAHLLVMVLAVSCYALFMGAFDWFAGNSTATAIGATRWISFLVFLGVLGFLLLQTGRCGVRRVNPYFVAHQLEQTLPNAKNILINWLDLRDEAMPSAFQKTLSARAAEQLQESDVERPVQKRKNWILLGSLVAPTVGLLVLLVLGPSAFASSMLRAFLPFYTPAPIARTQINLVQPEGGDAEVSPTQSITFTAKIEGRFPVGNRPDAPTLSYRYQASEDFLTLPLQNEGAGIWTTQLTSTQIRTGFTYKISAGDAETPEHQVRVRTGTHVKKFEITYLHRPYRKLPTRTFTFPNEQATKPIIRGLRGTEVELVVRASRTIKNPNIEIMTANAKKPADVRMIGDDAFACTLTLDQPGQFRVVFASADGEENSDREWYLIEVPDDERPKVVLTKPGKDVQLPVNGTLELEGLASSDVGLKNLTLHFRVANVAEPPTLAPQVYRPDLSFNLDDGSYPDAIEYRDVVALDQFKKGDGTPISLTAGTVIEYWLEGTDCTDYQQPAGNVGKSDVYKITLMPAAKDQAAPRKSAVSRKEKHDKKQDADRAAKNKKSQQNQANGGSQPNSQPSPDDKKEQKKAEDKIKAAQKQEEQNKGRGEAKQTEQPDASAKGGPQQSPDGPQPQKKDQPPLSPDDAGTNKEQGAGSGGQAKDQPQEPKSKDSSKGESKDGPKDPVGGAKGAKDGKPADTAKGAGPMGMNTPMPSEPKGKPGSEDGAPMASAKPGKAEANAKEAPQQAKVKGADQNGPELPNKDQQAAKDQSPPPNGQSKGGAMNDAGGDSKPGSPDQAKQPGSARGDDSKARPNENGLDDLKKLADKLADKGADDKDFSDIAAIGKNSDDPRARDAAQDILKANGRDPKTGKELEKKKGPNPFALGGGPFAGLSDEVKTAAANREFAARIGQMQLDDWQKWMTPDRLKKAGMTPAEWQNYLKSRQTYDAQVRELNAKLLKEALKIALLRGGNAGSSTEVKSTAASNDPLDASRGSPPPELRDAEKRFKRPNP